MSAQEERRQLAPAERKELRARAHSLQPVVRVGKGLVTPGLVDEIEQALESHELIKVKFLEGKDRKEKLCEVIAQQTGCLQIDVIGNIGIFYRKQTKRRKQNKK